jgi:transcriptional regulator of NAD metabolism
MRLRKLNTRPKQLGFALPSDVSEALEHLEGASFLVTLDEDGIHYRLLHADETEKVDLPSWASVEP